MASYFEITPSNKKLYKDFKTIFVFKFGPKTKKFTPKWQIPLFEKRVANCVDGDDVDGVNRFCIADLGSGVVQPFGGSEVCHKL